MSEKKKTKKREEVEIKVKDLEAGKVEKKTSAKPEKLKKEEKETSEKDISLCDPEKLKTIPDTSKTETKQVPKETKLLIVPTGTDKTIAEDIDENPPKGWEGFFRNIKPEMKKISDNLEKVMKKKPKMVKKKWIFYPLKKDVFNVYRALPKRGVKVVILGQDPYPGLCDGKPIATGRSFSVKKGVKIPPSLANIFNEIDSEFEDFEYPDNGNLEGWEEQGVFLLNAALTFNPYAEQMEVKSKKTMSGIWYPLIAETLRKISKQKGIVFMLWGNDAQAYEDEISEDGNLILKSSHPSPFAYNKGETPFKGNGHFVKANEFLLKNEKEPINWSHTNK